MWLFLLLLGGIVSVVQSSISSSEFLPNSIFPQLPPGVLYSNNFECQEESDSYRKNLQNFTLWAYEMWDATAKTPTGWLRGNVFHMGHFDQCLTVEAPFKTQYCLTSFTANVPNPKIDRDPKSLYHHPYEEIRDRLYFYEDRSQQRRNVIQMGWCIPASCTVDDLNEFLTSHMNLVNSTLREFNVSYEAKVADLTCQQDEKVGIVTTGSVIFCFVVLILILIALMSTVYDFILSGNEKKAPHKNLPQKLFLAFSLKSNWHHLPKTDESDPALTILYGMKTFCITMIILDHRFGTFLSSALMNFNFIEEEYRSPYACFIFHGDLFVDSFFTLGGLLVAYGMLNHLEKKPLNPAFLIFMRYIRLTPIYAFVIFYYVSVFEYTGTGPLWQIIAGQDAQDCRDNWWTNLLYISNYVNTDHMCMAHSWYLPCDFHYFIIGIFVCYLIKKQKRLGLFILLILTIISILIPFALTLIYLRPGVMNFYPEFLTAPKTHTDFQLTYTKTHTRASSYFIGMFAGYLYYQLKGTNKHVCRIKSAVILLVSILLILTSIIGGGIFYDPYHEYNALESAFYAALHRPAFCLGTVGILYVTSYGHGKFLYKILSWSPLIPLSKLVYGAYLVHFQFQLRSAARFMNPQFFSYFDVISLGISDVSLAFLTALALYLLIEAPLRKIFKELMTPPRKETGNGDNNTRENMMNGNSVNLNSRL